MAKRVNKLGAMIKAAMPKRTRAAVEPTTPEQQAVAEAPNPLDFVDCKVLWDAVCSIPDVGGKPIPLVRDDTLGYSGGAVHTFKQDNAVTAGCLLHELSHLWPHEPADGYTSTQTSRAAYLAAYKDWREQRAKYPSQPQDGCNELALNLVLDILDESVMEQHHLPDSARFFNMSNRNAMQLLLKASHQDLDPQGRPILVVDSVEGAALLWYFHHRNCLSGDAQKLIANSLTALKDVTRVDLSNLEPYGVGQVKRDWHGASATAVRLADLLRRLPFPPPPPPEAGGDKSEGEGGDPNQQQADANSRLRAAAAHNATDGKSGQIYSDPSKGCGNHSANRRTGLPDGEYNRLRDIFATDAWELLRSSVPELERQHQCGATIRHPARLVIDGRCLVSPIPACEQVDTAVAILLDTSGSMSGCMQRVAACAGAMGEAFRSMGASVKSWCFDNSGYEVPLKYLKFSRADGGTTLGGAARSARDWLANCFESKKFLVMLTDGSCCDPAESANYISDMVAAGVTPIACDIGNDPKLRQYLQTLAPTAHILTIQTNSELTNSFSNLVRDIMPVDRDPWS